MQWQSHRVAESRKRNMPRQNGFFVGSKVNTFKKYEITKQQTTNINPQRRVLRLRCLGQASFEYFVLFILLAFFCLWGISQALPFAHQAIENEVFEEAVVSIAAYTADR